MAKSLPIDPEILACPLCKGQLRREGPCLLCPACPGMRFEETDGLLDFVSPLLDPSKPHTRILKANQALHDTLGAEYAKDPMIRQQFSRSSNRRLQEVIQDCMKELPHVSGLRLLDIGTGTGLALDLADGLVSEAVGVDVSPGMLREAKRKGHSVYLGDAAHLPFSDEGFDLVTIDSVLHHLYDIPAILKEGYRVLRPGGFLITDWDPNGLSSLIQRHPLHRALLRWTQKVRYLLQQRPKNPIDKEQYQWAEYHRFHGEPIFPVSLKGFLEEARFRDIRVIAHANHPSIHNMALRTLSMWSLCRIAVLCILGRTVQKDRIFEILLSISRK